MLRYRGRTIDIPSALTDGETEALQELAVGKYVLEGGALPGYSTVALAQVAAHVVSVDPHEGYPEHDPRPTFDQYIDNLERYHVREKVTPVIARFEDAITHLDLDTFDLAFLDLTGHYDDTAGAMDELDHFVTSGRGILAVHDCGHEDWPGVKKAVEEHARDWRIEPRIVDRLAIFDGNAL